MKKSIDSTRDRAAWLEILLALAAIALAFQLIPSLGSMATYAIDVRNWSRTVWFSVNSAIVLSLLAFRFVPDLLADWQQRQLRLRAEQGKATKASKLLEQKKSIERMEESRHRRMY